jgi:predicted negative regulator of RcsB-dependent stress response
VENQYHEEDDLEKLKRWWKDYGSALVIGVVLGTAALFGYRYWNQYQFEQAANASALYDQVTYNMKQKNIDRAETIGGQIMEKFDSTPYAGMAALLLAKISYENDKPEDARRQLRWAMDHAKVAATRHAARVRLARLIGETGDATAALALLKVDDRGGFESEYSELQGDLLAKQGKIDEARAAYASALSRSSSREYGAILRMKIADLGQKETVQ